MSITTNIEAVRALRNLAPEGLSDKELQILDNKINEPSMVAGLCGTCIYLYGLRDKLTAEERAAVSELMIYIDENGWWRSRMMDGDVKMKDNMVEIEEGA